MMGPPVGVTIGRQAASSSPRNWSMRRILSGTLLMPNSCRIEKSPA